MRLRVVVSDQGEACFYDIHNGDMQLVARLTDPQAHLHDRDIKSDRPGRVFDHAPSPGRRGATAHHATGGEHTPRRHAAEVFARKVAETLLRGRQRAEYDGVVLVAAPTFLGLLRHALAEPVRSRIQAEIPKDLVHQDVAALARYLPSSIGTAPR